MESAESVYRLRSVSISQGTREAANGPEYLLMRTQAQWPLDDFGGIRDREWLSKHPDFCQKWGVDLSIMAGASVTVRVWYSSTTIVTSENGNGNGQH